MLQSTAHTVVLLTAHTPGLLAYERNLYKNVGTFDNIFDEIFIYVLYILF